MKILTGIDIVKISRITTAKSREGSAFVSDNFLENESQNSDDTLAGIFAAKEAFIKCIGYPIDKKKIEILKNDMGKPMIKLREEIKDIQIQSIDLSISHDGDYAVASVTILI